ncbi:HD domain-containing protein [Clostridium sp. YIM B02500]|uniref:HD domain-containing protein n=1 Tax=Clostridium sp. YIM B02500 TaxID=2910681 RepID=UPI001EEEC98B|nr:HD domain-containing protein [Clostridium sp. YIM B02500]
MINNKIIYMSDTVHGTIQISEIEKRIISTPIFNRLHNISQNSTAYLTFSTNRTKRFEHSIGTMYLASKMFFSSIANAEKDILAKFFHQLHNEMDTLIDRILEERLYKHEIGNRNLKKITLKDYNNFIIPNNMKNILIPCNIIQENEFLYLVVMQSVRLSALLHDVGHPPFSHIAEYALKSVWIKINDKKVDDRNENEIRYYNILEKYFENNGELHEQIGNSLTERVLETLMEAMPKNKQDDKDVLSNQMFLIMVKEVTSSILNEKSLIFKNIHKLIDGSLDCDRLDYVTRDVLNSGFNKGIIEYERLISSMKLIENANGDFIFSPHMKVLNNVEDFFERRWDLYKQIIFHHRVIKTDYLLNNCIQELICRYLENNQGPSEMKNNILPYDISGLWLAVQGDPCDDVFFNQLIQWDDSWLMVVLKKEFLSIDEKDENLKILRSKLKELLANEKYYYSVIKKPDDFINIENEVINLLQANKGEIEKEIKEMEQSKSISNSSDSNKSIVIDPFLNDLKKMISCIDHADFSRKGFILPKIKNLIFSNYLSEEEFDNIVRSSVEQAVSEYGDIEHGIVEFKNIKLGVQEGLSLYSSDGSLKPFKKVSNIAPLLMFRKEFLPPFYIYISKIDTDISINYDKFKKVIGENIANSVYKKLKELFLEYK